MRICQSNTARPISISRQTLSLSEHSKNLPAFELHLDDTAIKAKSKYLGCLTLTLSYVTMQTGQHILNEQGFNMPRHMINHSEEMEI